jgi:hypothetical protein
VLLYDDVVADGETEPGALPRRFGSEEGLEYLFLHIHRYAGTIVVDRDFCAFR